MIATPSASPGSSGVLSLLNQAANRRGCWGRRGIKSHRHSPWLTYRWERDNPDARGSTRFFGWFEPGSCDRCHPLPSWTGNNPGRIAFAIPPRFVRTHPAASTAFQGKTNCLRISRQVRSSSGPRARTQHQAPYSTSHHARGSADQDYDPQESDYPGGIDCQERGHPVSGHQGTECFADR